MKVKVKSKTRCKEIKSALKSMHFGRNAKQTIKWKVTNKERMISKQKYPKPYRIAQKSAEFLRKTKILLKTI